MVESVISRRNILRLSGAAAAAAAGGCSHLPWRGNAAQDVGPMSEEEYLSILRDEASEDDWNAGTGAKGWVAPRDFTWCDNGCENLPSWHKIVEFVDAAKPRWPAPGESVDYHHLARYAPPGSGSFDLDGDVLAFLASRNEFRISERLNGNKSHVLFGLRGAILPEGDDTGWSRRHRLQLATPDHVNFRCVLGVWDRRKNQLRCFTGSTVPHAAYMWAQVNRLFACNMMPTGAYLYRVGPHPRKSTRSKQVGAFRMQGAYFEPKDGAATRPDSVFVVRTLNDMAYTTRAAKEAWSTVNPGDHIHSAVFNYDTPGRRRHSGGQKFASAGCQIVKGDYHLDAERRFTTQPDGPWAYFRAAAGLRRNPKMLDGSSVRTEDDGIEFQYFLFTGLEAALAATGATGFRRDYACIRFGSFGPNAAALQRALGLSGDGKVGATTLTALIERQTARDALASPVHAAPFGGVS